MRTINLKYQRAVHFPMLIGGFSGNYRTSIEDKFRPLVHSIEGTHTHSNTVLNVFINQLIAERDEIISFGDAFPLQNTFINLQTIWSRLPKELAEELTEENITYLTNGTFSIEIQLMDRKAVINIGSKWFNYYILSGDNVKCSRENLDFKTGIETLFMDLQKSLMNSEVHKYLELKIMERTKECV